MDISVVIPAYNEEAFIANTILSILQGIPSTFQYEIIVVDHGSTDKTADIALKSGAIVIDGSGLKTIAALRNFGVMHSCGKALFFIDADITFTKHWSKNISKVVQDLNHNPNQICGSLPKIPENASLIMKCWFEPKSMDKTPKYIGSCHLLTSRVLFDKVGGFPAEMETAEEFNFCVNATNSGAKISATPELVVTHQGAPKTLLDFAKREVWHGRGDWTNLSSIISSKVALLTLIFISLHAILFTYLFSEEVKIAAVFFQVILIALLCLVASIIKFFEHGAKYIAINAVTFYIYFFARGISLFSAVFSKKIKKRSRS
jgi:glycosyltransferase involved in cell wall biosynthesis